MKIILLRIILLGTLLSSFLFTFSNNKYIRSKEKVGIDTVGIQSLPSAISIPMEIDIKEIESIINSKLKGEIYTDKSFENNNTDNLMLRVWKIGNFSMSVENNELDYKVPLRIWAKVRLKYNKGGIKISDNKEINGSIVLKFRTRFSLLPDWTFFTQTESNGFEWIKKPTINIAGLNMPVTLFANTALRNSQHTITSKIDKMIHEKINLKEMISPYWKTIQMPIKPSDEYNLWIKLTPLQINSIPLQGQDNKLTTHLTIKAMAQAYIGQKPEVSTFSAIPDILFADSVNNRSEINLITEVSYPELNSIAKKLLTEKTFSSDQKSVTIEDLNIFEDSGKINVDVSVSGSMNGQLRLTGDPYFDPSDSTFKIKDLDFDLQTRNTIAKSANWLMHHKLAEKIQDKLNLTIAKKMEDAKQMICHMLTDKDLGYNVHLTGRLDGLYVNEILLAKESIKANLLFKGGINLIMKK